MFIGSALILIGVLEIVAVIFVLLSDPGLITFTIFFLVVTSALVTMALGHICYNVATLVQVFTQNDVAKTVDTTTDKTSEEEEEKRVALLRDLGVKF